MNPVLIYLAGPIDDIPLDAARGWREELMAGAPAGMAFFSPAHAYFNVTAATFMPVENCNRAAIRQCHGVLANLAGPGMGFGTIREIEFSRSLSIPVAVVSDSPIKSLMVIDLYAAESLKDGLDMLLEAIQETRNQPPAFWSFLGGRDE